ncbi:MAG: molybdopterin molybdenumtransferase MoeA, partial [Cyclobacteriaceae bacterium]|nr:molybdopterin molybdenumtransferase MoeA [Cyclobacteriaceae bacterium]
FDFIPEVLEELGVKKMFHRISQKPGKPFWFGVKEGKKVVFAFPGNPVSTFLCYHKYLVPWLKKSFGLIQLPPRNAILAQDFSIKTSLTYFLQVKTDIDENGHLLAYPKVGRGSGDHANLLSSDAFLELPGNTFDFKKGEIFNLIPFRNI